jgi:hypothetical protein
MDLQIPSYSAETLRQLAQFMQHLHQQVPDQARTPELYAQHTLWQQFIRSHIGSLAQSETKGRRRYKVICHHSTKLITALILSNILRDQRKLKLCIELSTKLIFGWSSDMTHAVTGMLKDQGAIPSRATLGYQQFPIHAYYRI